MNITLMLMKFKRKNKEGEE